MKTVQALPGMYVEDMIEVIKRTLAEAFKLFGRRKDWKGRRGGKYFCVASGEHGIPHFLTIIGELPALEAMKYANLCQENATRLAVHPEHISSWQSRNSDVDQHDGAIRVGDHIYSLSGLPKLGNEAVMVIVCMVLYSFDPAKTKAIREIPKISKNPYWKRLEGKIDNLVQFHREIASRHIAGTRR